MGRPEEEFEVSLLTKLGTVALIISALCQLIGMIFVPYRKTFAYRDQK